MSRALAILKEVFGYHAFRGRQGEIIDHVAEGGDCLVLMPTGGGKSLCYQIPALLRRQAGHGVGIVVSPLIALMQDQVAALTEAGVRAAVLNSTLSSSEASAVERDLLAGRLDILYVAPERLMTPRFLDLLERTRVGLFAIDEAHCVSQWGHDFRPEYIQLSVLHERFPRVPRIALTATADALTRQEIVERLALDEASVFISSFDRPNIRYRIIEKDNARQQLLAFIKAEHMNTTGGHDSGIVYCLSRKKVEDTAAWLSSHGINALGYHAGMDSQIARRTRPDSAWKRDRDGSHHRFRHGYRQAGRTLCGAPGPAQEHGRVLPGNRTRGARRPARQCMDGIRAGRCSAAEAHDRRVGSDEAHKRVSSSKLDALLGL
jgi:ATP-dependent DNA helicase RecQ